MGKLFNHIMEVNTDFIDDELKDISNSIENPEEWEKISDPDVKNALKTDTDDTLNNENDEEILNAVIAEIARTPHSYIIDYKHDENSDVYPGKIVKMYLDELQDLRNEVQSEIDDDRLVDRLEEDDETLIDLLSFIDLVIKVREEIENDHV